MQFHPAAQILTWCMLVASMQILPSGIMLVTAGLVLLCAFAVAGRKFMQLMRRARWIMLSILLIYAYSTAGQPLSDALGVFSPSREGLADGLLQLTRLLSGLAGLSILLDRLHRQQLIAGLYTLFVPMQWLGLSRERFAVRLALTLHYAEATMLRETHNWQDALRSLFEPHGETARHMELPLYHFAVRDALLLAVVSMIFWLAIR